MTAIGVFPFGQEVRVVAQQDQTPKHAFILGVYASAVHAKWIGSNNRVTVNALAVASEPYIFWEGDGAKDIIGQITIPRELGRLEPADKLHNGPSGIRLNKSFLEPLGLNRQDAWLCDLVPHSCLNPNQLKAIYRSYLPEMKRFDLPIPTVPLAADIFRNRIYDTRRRQAILEELMTSQAELLVLLGDQPIKHFLHHFDRRWNKLSDFGSGCETYGQRHEININGRKLGILPMAHPRHVGKLGNHSAKWQKLHTNWAANMLAASQNKQ